MRKDQGRAAKFMSDFVERTGLTSDVLAQRYLWTDAFAVCTLLELYSCSREERYRVQCERLIDQVHYVLGRHRADDSRNGWLSGLDEEKGAAHPTRGGLRIGKPLPERGMHEPIDERLEWDRDGQYFHYLTKWMDALVRAAVLLGRRDYLHHAVELAKFTLPRFLLRSASGEPMALAWKMSIDLSRPQTAGSSPHDALDGYVTFRMLEWASNGKPEPDLDAETGMLRHMSQGRNWTTYDPLGLGGLMLDLMRILLLPSSGASDANLVAAILNGTSVGLQYLTRRPFLGEPATQRLAFREIGLAIGLQSLAMVREQSRHWAYGRGSVEQDLNALRQYSGLGRQILAFWGAPDARSNETWHDHREINEVMLASALVRAQPATVLRALSTDSARA